jgi:hypothetical protein
MDNIHMVEMSQSLRDLKQSIFFIKKRNKFGMLFGRQDHFGKRSTAKVESYVEEIVAAFLAVVSNDIPMIITRLKKLDFMLC